ncbi:MAG TPA: type II toxin-antitoxin system VapB family antitoxin [Acidobacteriota bacterium]|jgi:hypothetical protein
MARTTILLDDELLLEVRELANASGKTTTAVIHEALEAYVKQGRSARTLSFAGVGKSGRRSISRNAETILRRKANRRKGW